jgi:hypothetical protein
MGGIRVAPAQRLDELLRRLGRFRRRDESEETRALVAELGFGAPERDPEAPARRERAAQAGWLRSGTAAAATASAGPPASVRS